MLPAHDSANDQPLALVTDHDAERMLERLADARAELARLDKLHADRIAVLAGRHEALAKPVQDDIARLQASVGAYTTLAYPDRKTVPFMGGTVRHRKGADTIEVADPDAFTAWAQQHRPDLLRVRTEPDKAAIKKAGRPVCPTGGPAALTTDAGEELPGVALIPGETRTHIETSEVTS